VLLAVEARFVRVPDGTVYSPQELDGGFWDRYLSVFESITLVARLREGGEPPVSGRPVPGCVRFVAVPHYLGPAQYARRSVEVRRVVDRAAREVAGAALVRLPGIVGSHLARSARAVGRPYAVEMVGDPWEALSVVPGGPLVRLPLRLALMTRTRRDCRGASVVSYVDEAGLRRRYPAGPSAVVAHHSDVDLPPAAFAPRPRVYVAPARRLVAVGSLEVSYKGIDVLLDVVARFPRERRPRLTVVGGGRLLESYRAQAARLALGGDVRFVGRLPAGEAVRRELDAADVFVMPSRTEGMPRAMIEAMARGLPCVGSDVGGIPELLDPPEMVPAGDAAALHRTLAALLGDHTRLSRLSERNLERARRFAVDVLAPRRAGTYRSVQERTAWRPGT
jgi:glycosyltransferase involved in cell wall biosynthesis